MLFIDCLCQLHCSIHDIVLVMVLVLLCNPHFKHMAFGTTDVDTLVWC